MKVLITGSSGFVGKNVLQYLAENTDWQIDVLSTDLSKPFTLNKKFDAIINLASISSVERSIQEPVEVIRNNVMLITQLLETIRVKPPKIFIQLSTIEAQNITNPYAASKKAQEDICMAYARTYNIPIIVLQSTNIIGRGQSPDKFVPKIIKEIKNGKTVTIYTTNGNIGERIYNSVKNVATTMEWIIKNFHKYGLDDGYQEYGIAGGTKLNNLRMAQSIAKLLDTNLFCEFIDASTIRPSYLMDYKEQTKYVPSVRPMQKLDEALKELL